MIWILFLIAIGYWLYVPTTHELLPEFEEALEDKKKKGIEIFWTTDLWEESYILKTPFGKTRYYCKGPPQGRKIVFVHGITATAHSYPLMIQGLADRGYRVLLFDLFGRGYSDSPGTHYNMALYVSQLYFLVTQLKWDRFSLIGLSLGGAIATGFAHQFPQKIEKLILIAPAG